ncbi:hypothetical protein HU200_067641 [Digitaria exilis]|uniref:Vacuolar iron transporter n=1 Tax=Digitaria exilis TaxID=1010633 RepID=A0A835DVS8_9POAL|nr:hypothetical protein HU200_067641 [Digitaria exilis]
MAATAIVTNDDDIKLTIVVGTLHADEAATAMSSPPSPASKQPAPRHHVGQWLRAAVLGASDGLVSTAALILGVGAAAAHDGDDDRRHAVLLAGLAGLIAGACSMAIGEYVSVHAQLDVEVAELKRASSSSPAAIAEDGGGGGSPELQDAGGLSSPGQAAAASAVAFAAGGGVPLLAAWLVGGYRARVVVVVATASVALAVFGSLGAVLGRAPGGRAGLRAVVGGLVAMGITYGLMKVFRIHDV